MVRYRHNVDPRLRELERAVSAGDEDAIAPLLAARLRAGEVTREDLKRAEFFSSPWLTVLGNLFPAYNWHPIDWDPHPPGPVPEWVWPDPVTLTYWRALYDVLGDDDWHPPWIFLREAKTHPPNSPVLFTDGFSVFETGGDVNHAPFEIQWIAEPEHGYQEIGQVQQVLKYIDDAPDGLSDRDLLVAGRQEGFHFHVQENLEYFGDVAGKYFVRREAFKHVRWAVDLLAWLRRNSTVEYISLLGGWDPLASHPHAPWPPPSHHTGVWQQRELELVRSWLGGSPL